VGAGQVTERRSTVNRITFPVDEATRALWESLRPWPYPLGRAKVLEILAGADAANHNAIRNLLYAFRSGQL
jgi:hypothetical protein